MLEILKQYGYNSFLELYKVLEESKLAGEKVISLAKRRPVMEVNRVTNAKRKVDKWEEITLEVEMIKARAFEELYERLPPADLWDSVAALCTIGQIGPNAERAGRLLEAVKKIPTK